MTFNKHPSSSEHEIPVERREVFIPGFIKINNELNMQCLSFSILKALLPSLNRSDICGVREIRLKQPTIGVKNPNNGFTSMIVRLKSYDHVRMIMHARKYTKKLTATITFQRPTLI